MLPLLPPLDPNLCCMKIPDNAGIPGAESLTLGVEAAFTAANEDLSIANIISPFFVPNGCCVEASC